MSDENDSNFGRCHGHDHDHDDDHFSSVGSNILSTTSPRDDQCDYKLIRNMHVTAEELKIREELTMEIEKQLERELMDGILVLVRRLSHLKAKQIAKNLDLDLLSLRN
ncbi:hypothetical protein COLO4_37830 [Corchorus olitorius]|uniref:Uncharacterized protein n=1 Tax=Corchorus olitorius TaxID=93759 RepID=A0A1R3FZ11_9ROSI|nr:hypothetical protein COLO4_37830 [Corchorus olitorius]